MLPNRTPNLCCRYGNDRNSKHSSGTTRTVLILEDNPCLSRMMVDELTSLGCRVMIALSSRTAQMDLDLCAADIVLVSFHWNQGTGWEVFNCLKSENSERTLLLYTIEEWTSGEMKAILEVLAEALGDNKLKTASYGR